jgi:hypothetical protein
MTAREIQLQHLLGRKARDVDGRPVGRVEEMVVENTDGEFLVLEFHLGSAAVFERILGVARQLPFLKYLPRGRRTVYCVRWSEMDLADLDHPRVTVRREHLDRKTNG